MHICCARLGAICYSTLSTPALFTRGLGGLNGGLNGGLIALGLNGDPNAHGAQRLPKRPSAVETRCPNGPNARELNAHLLGPVGVGQCNDEGYVLVSHHLFLLIPVQHWAGIPGAQGRE